jgi:hypothetical protein
MLNGSFWRLLLLAVVLIVPAVPLVGASTPANNIDPSHSVDGQTITGFAMDPTGEFVTAVVAVDTNKLVGGLAGGTLPGQTTHHDIYPCDFGPANSRATGSGCRTGLDHGNTYEATATPSSNAQTVSYTSYQSASGLQPVFAVGGPSNTVSLWTGISDTPNWEAQSPKTGDVTGNVSISPDAQRVVAAMLPAATTQPGSIEVYDAGIHTGQSFLWDWNFSDQRPTALAYARSGSLLVVGTNTVSSTSTGGIYIFHPSGSQPQSAAGVPSVDMGSNVQSVGVSRNAEDIAVGTTGGVHYVPMNANGTPQSLSWSRDLPGGAQAVAITLDGQHFAAASGSKIYVYRATNDNYIAQQVGDPYDAGATVSDLSFDATGQLLVAVAGSNVIGFGPVSATPMWSFDATSSTHGALDAPLKRVIVSDGAERIVVAGQTRVMAYRSTVAASAAFLDAQGLTVQPSTTQRFSFKVTNTGSLADNYTFIAHFPVGWNGQGPDGVALLPDQSATLNVSVDVPPGTAPGIFGLDVAVRSQVLQDAGSANPLVAGPALNFTVPRAVILNVTTSEDRIPSIHAGNSETLPVTIRNLGNAEGLVNLSTTQVVSRGAPWPLHFDQPQVRVPAGNEVTVNLVVAPGTDAASGDRDDITICAREGQPTPCQMDGSLNEAWHVVTAYVDPKFASEFSSTNDTYEFGPGEIQTFYVKVTNTGNTDDIFNLSATLTPANVANDWRVTLDKDHVAIPHGESRQLGVTVRPGVSDPREASLIIKSISNGSAQSETSALTLSLLPKAPTVTTTKSLVPAPGLDIVLACLGLVALAARLRTRGGRP